jgi:hypothetical protein
MTLKNQRNEILRRIDEEGHFELVKIPKHIVLPNSVAKQRWDLLIIIMVLYNVVLTPM